MFELYEELGETIVRLLPLVFSLVWGYFVFKTLLIKHWLVAVNAKKVADQTIVFFIVYGVLIVFALMFLVGILAAL